jgi:hypothetical protein
MRLSLLFAFVLIGSLAVGAYANSTSVTTKAYAANSGVLTNVYFESATASASTIPSLLTALLQPLTTGLTTITRGSTDYIYSTQFTSARSVPAGSWVIDAWALGATSGTMTITVTIVNSAGTVQTAIGSGTTPTIATTKGQVALRVTGVAASIPANGYLRVSFAAPTGGGNPASFTLYWGKAQGTNFQVPMSTVSS